MFKIISTKRYKDLLLFEEENEQWSALLKESEETYHCGYKSCQFHTTSPKGLSIHRAKAHNHNEKKLHILVD